MDFCINASKFWCKLYLLYNWPIPTLVAVMSLKVNQPRPALIFAMPHCCCCCWFWCSSAGPVVELWFMPTEIWHNHMGHKYVGSVCLWSWFRVPLCCWGFCSWSCSCSSCYCKAQMPWGQLLPVLFCGQHSICVSECSNKTHEWVGMLGYWVYATDTAIDCSHRQLPILAMGSNDNNRPNARSAWPTATTYVHCEKIHPN